MTILVSTGLPKVDVPGVVGDQATDAVAAITRTRPEGRRPPHQLRQGDRAPSPDRIRRRKPGSSRARGCGSTSRRARSRSGCRLSSACPTSRPRDSSRARASRSRAATSSRTIRRTRSCRRIRPRTACREGLHGHSVRLEGPEGSGRPRRGELLACRRDRHAAQLRLQGGRGHERRPGPEPDGVVLFQTPGAGTSATPGSTVTITVGHYAPPPTDDDDHPHDDRPTTDTTDDRHDHARHDSGPVSTRRRVAVLMGGRSSEHAISLASARSVIEALDPERYEVVSLEIGRDGRWALPSGSAPQALGPGDAPPRTATAARSGRVGRGRGHAGRRRGRPADPARPVRRGRPRCRGCWRWRACRTSAPTTPPRPLCMDKDLFKAVMRDQGIPVTRNVTLRDGAAPENPFGYPVFVKPARLGSSVGISKAHDDEELARRGRARLPPRREGPGRGVRLRGRGRGRRARQPRAVRVARRRDRRHP